MIFEGFHYDFMEMRILTEESSLILKSQVGTATAKILYNLEECEVGCKELASKFLGKRNSEKGW